MIAIEQPEMAEDTRFKHNMGRVEHEKEIDAAIEKMDSSTDSRKSAFHHG